HPPRRARVPLHHGPHRHPRHRRPRGPGPAAPPAGAPARAAATARVPPILRVLRPAVGPAGARRSGWWPSGRVVAAGVPRVAAEQPADALPESADQPVLAQGADHVAAATGVEPADVADERGD